MTGFALKPRWSPISPEELKRLRALLDAKPELVVEAIDGLARAGDVESASRVMALESHESARVRGAVVRYTARVIPGDAWPLLARAADDPHFVVRENVAAELAELDAVRGRPILERLLQDVHAEVRRAAKSAVKR